MEKLYTPPSGQEMHPISFMDRAMPIINESLLLSAKLGLLKEKMYRKEITVPKKKRKTVLLPKSKYLKS